MDARTQVNPPLAWLAGAALWALLALTALVYWPGLDGPMLLDDHENLESLGGMLTGAASWQDVIVNRGIGVGGRPVAMLSFVANWLTSGGDVWSLKYTNLMIHLLCGTVLFWLAGRLLAEPLAGVGAGRWWLALLIAALWLLAPMLVSTVLYIIQRMAQLSALFALAGLLCYVAGRQLLAVRRRTAITLVLLCFLVFWPLAALSKQNGALLPLLAAIVEFSFFTRPQRNNDRRLVHGLLATLIALPLAAALIILGVDASRLGGSYQEQNFSIYERLITEARVLFDYTANLLMIPGGTPLGLFHDDFVVSRGVFDPPTTVIAIAAWIALLTTAWRLRGGRWAAILFGPVFFLAAHLLESTVFPLELYFEHRNYLPSVALFISIGVLVGRLAPRTRFRKALIAAVAIVPLANGMVTHARVLNWRSNETLLLASAQTHPDSARVHTGLAGLYVDRGDLDRAFQHLDRADALYDGRQSYAIALHRLVAYCNAERSVEAGHYAALAGQDRIRDTVYTVNALRRLAEKALGGGCSNVDLERVASLVSDHVSRIDGPGDSDRNWALRLYTATLLAAVGRKRDAVEHALAAGELQPTWLEPGLLAIEYQLDLGDLAGARRTLAELKRRDDGRVELYTRLIAGYEKRLEK